MYLNWYSNTKMKDMHVCNVLLQAQFFYVANNSPFWSGQYNYSSHGLGMQES